MTSDSPIPKLLLPASDAAAALSICEKTLWTLTEPRGPIRCVHIGRRVFYDPRDLLVWIVGKKAVPPTEAK